MAPRKPTARIATGAIAGVLLSTTALAEEIKVGFIGPLSGPVAVYGSEPLEASRAAVEEINASGILGEDEIVLIPADSAANPAQAAQAARRMVMSDEVVAIIGGHTSAETKAIIEATRNLEVPVVSTLAQSSSLTEGENQWFVRISQNTDTWGKAVATWLDSKDLAKTAYMLARNDSYGQSLQDAIAEGLDEVGISVIEKTLYDPQAKEFKAMLAKAQEADPDFLIISGFYTDTGLLVKQMAELGIETPYFNNTAVAIPQFSEIAGPAAEGAYGAVYYLPGSIESEKADAFVARWQEEHGELPTQYEGMGYDGVYLVADAIRRAKEGGELTRASLRDALFATENFAGATGTISIDEKGDVVRPLPIVQLRDGELNLEMLVE